MQFEWDEAKSDWTAEHRGFGFNLAILIFDGSTIERTDTRRDYGEDRIVAIGQADDLILTVTYTDRGDVRRIISARVANRKERALWRSGG